jgi:hypothetical protein
MMQFRNHKVHPFKVHNSTVLAYSRVTQLAGRWWLTPVILATQEAEIKRIVVRSQSRRIVLETLSRKYPTQKGLTQSVGPEFKLQH